MPANEGGPARLLTVPGYIEDYHPYLPTGNLHVSLPLVDPRDASVDRINLLHMASRSLIEFAGPAGSEVQESQPFMVPWLSIDGRGMDLIGNLRWERLEHWVPRFVAPGGGGANEGASQVRMEGTIFAPVGHRGFVYLLKVENHTTGPVHLELGLHGWWGPALQTIYTSRTVHAERHLLYNEWSRGPVFEVRPGTSLAALAAGASEELDVCEWAGVGRGEATVSGDEALYWKLGRQLELGAGEKHAVAFYWAVGAEVDGARTTVVDLARRGWRRLLEDTLAWLRVRHHELPAGVKGAGRLTQLLNLNKYFNYFYAQGYTTDTEDLVLVTSRSPRYYVSAAFWARDALLWSFPALLLVDPAHGREVLYTAFTRYLRNAGLHSLYIDGSLLYPGFELDELVAYLIALDRYVRLTGDETVLDEVWVAEGVDRVMSVLARKRHPRVALYETFLYPSDDPAEQPYVTYDNALVVFALQVAVDLYERWGRRREAAWAAGEARRVGEAVWEHCVVDSDNGPMFAWCADPDTGDYTVYDEPPGSLRMLPYYGFCSPDHPVYRATLAWIFSEANPHYYPGAKFDEVGCPHTDEPFVMGLFNSLLNGRIEPALEILREAELDGGLACEGFDRQIGVVRTGAAFATCAGFLAYALWYALVAPGVREGSGSTS